jgi:uncharacterized membrane protein
VRRRAAHPDLRHPSKHRRSFARFALWFASWQGTPVFVAMLTGAWITELLLNQLILPALHISPFDPSTWLLNLSLSLLAAYASSLSVMGSRVQSDAQNEQLDRIEAKLDTLLQNCKTGG